MRVALFEGYEGRGRRVLFPRGAPRAWASFGEALPYDLVEAANAAMDESVSALRWAITKIKLKLAVQIPSKLTLLAISPIGWVGSLFSNSEDMRNAAYSALNTYTNIVDRLDTSSRTDVLSGEESIDKWQAGADEVLKGISGLAKDLSEESTWQQTAATVSDSWERFKQRAEELGAQLPDIDRLSWAIPVALASVAAILIIPQVAPFLRFLRPKKRYSGYRRRKRR